ncbi:hypothetical protein HZS_3452 [Henneguya salminicola]|nr:hypothetical protein HZS_3452 [Henneguya salminicola]
MEHGPTQRIIELYWRFFRGSFSPEGKYFSAYRWNICMHAVSLLAGSRCHDLRFGLIVVSAMHVWPPHRKKRIFIFPTLHRNPNAAGLQMGFFQRHLGFRNEEAIKLAKINKNWIVRVKCKSIFSLNYWGAIFVGEKEKTLKLFKKCTDFKISFRAMAFF